jgi:hypothetical protein
MAETQTGTKELTTGIVDEVINIDDGTVALVIGNNTASLTDIVSVKN